MSTCIFGTLAKDFPWRKTQEKCPCNADFSPLCIFGMTISAKI
jgi:hypothetical protein